MNPMERHPSNYGRRPAEAAATDVAVREPVYPVFREQRADCCGAPPMFHIVLPPTTGRSRTAELYLCGHHRRHCGAALAAAHAVVFDASGHVVPTD